jgi:hypothetical protein
MPEPGGWPPGLDAVHDELRDRHVSGDVRILGGFVANASSVLD